MTLEEYIRVKARWPIGTAILDHRSDTFYVVFERENIVCRTDVFVSMVVQR